MDDEGSSGDMYLGFQTEGRFGPDAVEFLIRGRGIGDRNWEGDGDGSGLLVLYRSIGLTPKYLYPLTQPISDGGMQRKRMDAIRAELKYRLSGCELVECYL